MTDEIAGLKVNDRILLGAPWNCGATIVGFRYYTSRNNGRTSMVADYLTDTGEQTFDAIERVKQWREDQRQVAEQFEGVSKEPIAALGGYDVTFAGPYEPDVYHAYWRVPGDKDWRVCQQPDGDGGICPVKCESATDAVHVAARSLVAHLNRHA